MKIAKMTAKTSRPPTLAVIAMIIVQFCSLSSAHKLFGYICRQKTGHICTSCSRKWIVVMNNNYTASIGVSPGVAADANPTDFAQLNSISC